MLLDPNAWNLASRSTTCSPRCRRTWLERTAAGDARLGARARHRAARRRRPARSPSCAACAAAGEGDRAARHPRRGAPARTRSRSGRTSRSPPARATSSLYASMRELARREPTFAPARARRACRTPSWRCARYNRMRAHLPLLLALSANSPFWQGRDTGLARRARRSSRPSRASASRASSAPTPTTSRRIDLLIRCGAFPEPTFLWWDVRLQPRFGTLEVRVMDAQTRVADTAALVALVQCARAARGARGPRRPQRSSRARGARREPLPRRARRHGRAAHRPRPRAPRPAREWLDELLAACAPHAADLGCARRARVGARARGGHRRRAPALARRPRRGAAARALIRALHAEFTSPRSEPAFLTV